MNDEVVLGIDRAIGRDQTVEVETIRWADGSFTIASVYHRDGVVDRKGRHHDHVDPEYTGRVGCDACKERLAP